ncbi:unnamed protein product, partial [Rotaria magnacalcarata]
VRQGFKICLIGPKKSGKTSLASCLEENMPVNIDEDIEATQERIVHADDEELISCNLIVVISIMFHNSHSVLTIIASCIRLRMKDIALL